MKKTKIKLVTIGHMPLGLSLDRIFGHKSSVFEIAGEIENYTLTGNSDAEDWSFSDEAVREKLPELDDENFLIAVVNVRLQNNWYSRRVYENKIVFTFFEISEILEHHNIPLENVILRLLYGYTLLYLQKKKIPDISSATEHAHDETRGCLFDMTPYKYEIAASCNKPTICDECRIRLQGRVSSQAISQTDSEIKKIRKDLYYQIIDFIKLRPIFSLTLSSLIAVILGALGSLLGSFILTLISN